MEDNDYLVKSLGQNKESNSLILMKKLNWQQLKKNIKIISSKTSETIFRISYLRSFFLFYCKIIFLMIWMILKSRIFENSSSKNQKFDWNSSGRRFHACVQNISNIMHALTPNTTFYHFYEISNFPFIGPIGKNHPLSWTSAPPILERLHFSVF